jgi:hypothetical protein
MRVERAGGSRPAFRWTATQVRSAVPTARSRVITRACLPLAARTLRSLRSSSKSRRRRVPPFDLTAGWVALKARLPARPLIMNKMGKAPAMMTRPKQRYVHAEPILSKPCDQTEDQQNPCCKQEQGCNDRKKRDRNKAFHRKCGFELDELDDVATEIARVRQQRRRMPDDLQCLCADQKPHDVHLNVVCCLLKCCREPAGSARDPQAVRRQTRPAGGAPGEGYCHRPATPDRVDIAGCPFGKGCRPASAEGWSRDTSSCARGLASPRCAWALVNSAPSRNICVE